jgi:hypothetical protein
MLQSALTHPTNNCASLLKPVFQDNFMEIWEDLAIIAWTELLLDSYEQLIGRSLLPRIRYWQRTE